MTLEILHQFIRETFEPHIRRSAQFTPGVPIRLRTHSDFGAARLRSLLAILMADDQESLFLGFYASADDLGPSECLNGQELMGRLEYVPDTELDWDVWKTSYTAAMSMLEDAQVWPDLVIPMSRKWLIWTEDNTSFLCSSPKEPPAEVQHILDRFTGH